METDKIFMMKTAIEYAEGSVVSKTLIKKDKGSITLFAFDEGEALSEHTAPFEALVQVLDGSVEISIDGKKNRLNEGDCIIMPADVPHALKAVTPFKMLLSMIKA